jgi:hypothetical protein
MAAWNVDGIVGRDRGSQAAFAVSGISSIRTLDSHMPDADPRPKSTGQPVPWQQILRIIIASLQAHRTFDSGRSNY